MLKYISKQLKEYKKNDFKDLLLMAFIATDTTLKKLRCDEVVELFNRLGHDLPPKSTTRAHLLTHFSNSIIVNLPEKFINKNIHLVVGESDIEGVRYLSILGGLVCDPFKIYT